jgi:hypothetical protein
MRTLEGVLSGALKLSRAERRKLAARLLEEDVTPDSRQDERLEEMREAADDQSFLSDLSAAMEDFQHVGRQALG